MMKISYTKTIFYTSFRCYKLLDKLLMAGEVNDLLLAIDDAIIETFDEDGYPNETGNQLQKIYDEIYLMYE